LPVWESLDWTPLGDMEDVGDWAAWTDLWQKWIHPSTEGIRPAANPQPLVDALVPGREAWGT